MRPTPKRGIDATKEAMERMPPERIVNYERERQVHAEGIARDAAREYERAHPRPTMEQRIAALEAKVAELEAKAFCQCA